MQKSIEQEILRKIKTKVEVFLHLYHIKNIFHEKDFRSDARVVDILSILFRKMG